MIIQDFCLLVELPRLPVGDRPQHNDKQKHGPKTKPKLHSDFKISEVHWFYLFVSRR
jgi:hypothetical protein